MCVTEGRHKKMVFLVVLLSIVAVVVALDYAPSSQWTLVYGNVDKNTLIPLVFALSPINPEQLSPLLEGISTPGHPSYGQHMTHEQVSSMFTNEKAFNEVSSYLQNHGVDFTSTKAKDYIRVMVTVSVAEELLPGSTFVEFERNSVRIIRSQTPFKTPVDEYLDFVGYTTDFPVVNSNSIRSFALRSDTNGTVTPQTLMKTYNIRSNVCKSEATQGVFASLNQSYSQADLSQYLALFDLKDQTMDYVVGPDHPEDCFVHGGRDCGEANLDVQVITSLAQDSSTSFWSFPAPGSSEFEPFLEWILYVSDTPYPPAVFSVSYADVESELSPEYMKRFSMEVQKLGLRGVTVLAGSGDDGVGNVYVRKGIDACGYNPAWPASDPFITCIGATQGPESGLEEIGCSSSTGGVITTGGGFSNIFERPRYQNAAVQGYLAQNDGQGFHRKGRGYPDVSLLGYNYVVVLGGRIVTESGTSASTPAFAALVTLINGERLAMGKTTLGFLNPALYSAPATVFRDVVKGENHCSADPSLCCAEGFSATTGWDPVTGLGSIDFSLLKDYLISL